MNFVIKPLGAAFLLVAIAVLAVLAFRRGPESIPPSVSAPVAVPVVVSDTTPGRTPENSPPISASVSAVGAVATEAVRGHAIYRDGVENGWETVGWTWAKDVAYDDTSRPRSGTKAIRVRYSGFDGVKFHHTPLNTAPFDRISFYVNGGESGGQRIAVGAACSEKNVADGARLSALPANKWVAVTIPLTRISLSNRPDMTSFWIQGSSDKTQAPLYIDEVRLLRSGEPAPSGEALALSR